MPDLSAYSRTGRVQLGPGSDLVELQGPDGAHSTAIVFHPEYRGHNAINAALHVVLGFLESPMVHGLAELVTYDLAESTFVYPTGKVWSVAEVVRTVSDMGEAAGVRAGMEWLAHVGQILVEAAEAGEQAAVYSHGGVTPWRVVMDAEGRVQVIGHALPQVEILAFHEDSTRIPREDAFRYCPPERMEGRKENFSSDLFGAALIAFEIMTGRPVYDGLVDEIRARAARGETSRRLHQHRDVIPDPVREVLATALKPDIRDRFPSGGAFLEALDLAMRDRRVTGPGLREVMSRVARHVPRARQELDPARTSMLSRDALKKMLDDEAEPSVVAAPAPGPGAVRVSIPAGRARPAAPIGEEDLPGLRTPATAEPVAVSPRVAGPVPGARPNPRQVPAVAPAAVPPVPPSVAPPAPPAAPAPPPVGRPVMGARSNPRAAESPPEPPPPAPPPAPLPPAPPPPLAPVPERVEPPPAPPAGTSGAFARPLDARSLLARVRASGSEEARAAEAALRTSGSHTPPPALRAVAPAEAAPPPPPAPPRAPPPVAVAQAPSASPPAAPAPPAAPPPAPPAAPPPAPPPAAPASPPAAPPPAPRPSVAVSVPHATPPVAPPPVARAVEPPVARFLGAVGGDDDADEVDDAATAAFVRPPPRAPVSAAVPPVSPPQPAPAPAAPSPAPDLARPVVSPPVAAPSLPPVSDVADEATEPPARARLVSWRLRVGERTRPGTPSAASTPLGELVAGLYGAVLPWPVALDGRWSGWARLGTVAAPLPPETRLDALGPDPLLVLHRIEARIARVQVRAEGARSVRVDVGTTVPAGTLASSLRELLDLPEGDWVLIAGGRRLPAFAILEDLPAGERAALALERA